MYLYLYIIYIVITPDSSGVLRARIFAHLDEITHLQKKNRDCNYSDFLCRLET